MLLRFLKNAHMIDLLVRIRRPLDMLAQTVMAGLVAWAMGDALPLSQRLLYPFFTALVTGGQYLLHIRYSRDRNRRGATLPRWLALFYLVYGINGLLFGLVQTQLVVLPREEAALIAICVVVGLSVSVALTTAAMLWMSLLVIVCAYLPPVLVLLLRGQAGDASFAGIGALLGFMVCLFAMRLHLYYRRGRDVVSRLREGLRERGRASEAAQAAESRLRSILDTAPFPIVVARQADGAFLYSNRPAAELFGIALSDDPGAGLRYRLDPAHHHRIFAAAPDGAESAEFQLATARGNVIWATMAAVPMQYGDEAAALAVVHDVTARRESEHRLREVEQRLLDAIGAVPDGVALYGADERLLICNQAFADIIGIPLDAIGGMSHAAICQSSMITRPAPRHEADRRMLAQWLTEREATFAEAKGRPHIFFDTREKRWLQIRDFRLSDGGVASLITDITALKAVESALRDANETLEHQAGMLAARSETLEAARRAAIDAHRNADIANRAKSQFLAHMSHELRTPLNAILGFSEIMALQMLGASGVPQYDRYARDIHAAGRHLQTVIDDILDLSKIEAGRMELQREWLVWGSLKADCLILVRPQAADRQVRLQTEGAEDLRLFADSRLTKQMLVNLLSNAIKFTEAGGLVVLCAEAGEDGGMVLSVRDTGIGMSKADMEKALQPFGQADNAMLSQIRGTGLGLPLVKSLIELHGGRLEIDSIPGQGTNVRLYFPPAAQ